MRALHPAFEQAAPGSGSAPLSSPSGACPEFLSQGDGRAPQAHILSRRVALPVTPLTTACLSPILGLAGTRGPDLRDKAEREVWSLPLCCWLSD